MKYESMIREIVDLVGGPENVAAAYHCITRLRFKLKDESKADLKKLENVDGTMGVIQSAGQTQVIIGQHVGKVYAEMQQMYNFGTDESLAPADDAEFKDAKEFKGEMAEKKVSSGVLDFISGLFTPVLGMMVATGLIKGLCTLLSATGLIATTDGAYVLLYAIGDSFFTFLPIFLGFTAMKKMGGTPALGALIGAALVYPTLSSVTAGDPLFTLFEGTIFASPVYLTFFGIPVVLVSYTSTVIPVICICAIAAPLERWLSSHVNDAIDSFVTPAVTLLVSLVLGFLIIGPVVNIVSDLLGAAISAIYNSVPVVAGLLYGALIQVCVIFGVHWGFVAISVNNLATLGYDPVTICGMASAFGQAGVALAIFVHSRNKRLKGIAGSAALSAIAVGITEPCIYGVTLQRKKAFILACLSSAVGGAILGGFGVSQYIYGVNGLFGWLQVIPPTGFDITVAASIAACAVSLVLSFAGTLALWNKLDIEA